jgi:hypothetical protein
MRTKAVALLSLALAVPPIDDAFAQSRRDRSAFPSAPRENTERSARQPNAPQPPADPIASIERELPSLKVDLKLAADQAAAWAAFERDVRDAAETERARRRHVMALAGPSEAPSALALVKAVAEDDRMRAEAMADLRSHLQALYSALAHEQRLLLDRRVAQSQSEPLGR